MKKSKKVIVMKKSIPQRVDGFREFFKFADLLIQGREDEMPLEEELKVLKYCQSWRR